MTSYDGKRRPFDYRSGQAACPAVLVIVGSVVAACPERSRTGAAWSWEDAADTAAATVFQNVAREWARKVVAFRRILKS
jgi:hypothetical protein